MEAAAPGTLTPAPASRTGPYEPLRLAKVGKSRLPFTRFPDLSAARKISARSRRYLGDISAISRNQPKLLEASLKFLIFMSSIFLPRLVMVVVLMMREHRVAFWKPCLQWDFFEIHE